MRIREGTFLIGGDGPGLRRVGSFVNILQIWEGQTCFICNRWKVIVPWQGKNYSIVDSYSLANMRSVQKPKATSQNSSKLFYTGVKLLCQKNYLVPTNIVVWTCAHFRPYFHGGNVCVRGSGLRSVSGDHYLSYLRTRSTTSLFKSVSTLESDEVTCYSTFLRGGCRGC